MAAMKLPESWIEHDRKVRPYVWSHRRLAIVQAALGLVALGLLWKFGAGLEEALAAHLSGYGLWLAYFGALGGAWSVVTFPFGVGHWRIERAYDLSRQPFRAWMADMVKALLVGGILGAIAMGAVYASVRLASEHWWLAAATLLVLFSILLAQLAPVLLIPIFYKLRPMEPGPLKTRLLDLCRQFDIDVKDVYHLGMREKTEKGNAAFTGLGRTKRILIGDTLYEAFPPEQVEAVFAHELGHQVHHDLWKGIGLSTLGIYASFFLASLLVEVDGPYAFLRFFIALLFIRLPAGVLESAYSRSRERAADRFADERLGKGSALADALERLTFQNFGFFKPRALLEFLSHSHPAPWRRIAALRPRP